LYFCSEGHSSMGGYDLFTTTWDADTNKWSAPRNMGYPINTAGDEKTITFANEGKLAYISALRPGGFGNLDIYRITFPENYIIRIKLPMPNDPEAHITDAEIIIDGPPLEEPLLFAANPNNGIYTIVLKNPGAYQLTIDASGFMPYNEEIQLGNENIQYTNLITDKTIELSPKL